MPSSYIQFLAKKGRAEQLQNNADASTSTKGKKKASPRFKICTLLFNVSTSEPSQLTSRVEKEKLVQLGSLFAYRSTALRKTERSTHSTVKGELQIEAVCSRVTLWGVLVFDLIFRKWLQAKGPVRMLFLVKHSSIPEQHHMSDTNSQTHRQHAVFKANTGH